METGQLQDAGGRRRRVVLRASGKRRPFEVSEDSPDSTGDTGQGLDSMTHYDHGALGWHSPQRHARYHGNCGDGALEDTISSDVFYEKLELSGKVFHSTPSHPQVATIRHPMQPGDISSTIYKGQFAGSPSSSDIDGDDMFERPKTAMASLQIHPESPHHFNVDAFNSTLPPSRPHTSPSGNSTDITSPLHSKTHSKGKRKWGRKNRVHPGDTTTKPISSPAHSTTLKSTPSSGVSGSRLSESLNSTLSSTLAPLLTTSLRKGGKRPSVGTQWEPRGEEQLEALFPNRHIRVLVATWNMQEEKELPESLDDLLLPLSHELAADMYIIGTQESSPSRRDWELLLQQTLGPHHVLVHSASLGVIYLVFFLRRDLIWFCSAVHSTGVATRPFTPIKTKGGVGISFTLFGTSFLFITSHFTAHKQKVAERNSDMQTIAANLEESGSPAAKTFDHVFWLGDLNYRVELSREEADGYLARSDWMSLLLQDQLTKEILLGNVFSGYSEQPINFPPTYKFDHNSDTYDSSEKKRVPSWTDRVLFKSRVMMGITGCGYDSCRTLRCSDHRPVYAIFQVKLDPCNDIDGIPDSVGTFDREIYKKAHQQRKLAAQLSHSKGEDTPDAPSPPSRQVSSRFCTML